DSKGLSDARTTVEASGDKADSIEATKPDAESTDARLRSVSFALVTGVFHSHRGTPADSSALAAAHAVTMNLESCHPAADAPAPGISAAQSFVHGESACDAGASSSLRLTPTSSSRRRSSTRYQREIARIGAQVADALDYAYKRNVIHRDIKPHNILLDALG